MVPLKFYLFFLDSQLNTYTFRSDRENRVTKRFNARFLRDHQVAQPIDLFKTIDWSIFSLPRNLGGSWTYLLLYTLL